MMRGYLDSLHQQIRSVTGAAPMFNKVDSYVYWAACLALSFPPPAAVPENSVLAAAIASVLSSPPTGGGLSLLTTSGG